MDDPRYLLVKRGLYYRPDNCGYTGIKEHAGRYREVDALGLDGVMAIHEDEAPDYSSACFEDLKEAHLKSRIAALEAENAGLREAAKAVLDNFDSNRLYSENAPGHGHTVIGIWDDDNSHDKAGQPCEWCAQWAQFRARATGADHD